MNRIQRFISKRKRDIPFWFELLKRKYTSIFNYKRLSQDMELVTKEYTFNAYYGIDELVKRIEGIPFWQRLEAGVEHGIRFPQDDVWDEILTRDRIYIFGNARKQLIEQLHPDKEVLTHRNFMAYVKGIYSQAKIRRLRKKFGKTLLCIPTHSTHHVIDEFNQDILIEEIERIKKEYYFDTVMICMYWKDVLQGRQQTYVERGYTIVTAGHMYDRFFLRRLKSILHISDLVITNDSGSHIGYAVFENRPVYFFHVKTKNVALDNDVDFSIYESSEQRIRFSNEAKELFGEYSENISERQREFIRAHWGDF